MVILPKSFLVYQILILCRSRYVKNTGEARKRLWLSQADRLSKLRWSQCANKMEYK